MAANVLKDAPQVQRIMFKKYITPARMGHSESHVLSYSSRAAAVPLLDAEEKPAGIIQISQNVESRLDEAHTELCTHCMSDPNPYADKDGLVKRLTREVVGGETGPGAIITRALDILRPVTDPQTEFMAPRSVHSEEFNFMLSEGNAAIPDVLPYAGEILARAERRTLNTATDAKSILLTHVMEAFILATSVLREAGLDAYPSLAVWGDGEAEAYTPLMAVFGDEEIPLRTFALMPAHPNLSSIIILSDAAALGVLNVITAEIRVMHLCAGILEHSKVRTRIPDESLENQLKRIANALFEGHKLWPGTPFINDARVFLHNEVAKAMAVFILCDETVTSPLGGIPPALIRAFSSQLDFTEILGQMPTMLPPQVCEYLLKPLEGAYETGQNYAQDVMGFLARCIAAGRPLETFESNRKQR